MVTIEEIRQERARQIEKHPVKPKHLIRKPGMRIQELEHSMLVFQKINDYLEGIEEHNYYDLIQEELLEVITAKTREHRHTEIVQAIALLERLDDDEDV